MFMVGTYTIGKERILMRLNQVFKKKIFVSMDKYGSCRLWMVEDGCG